MDGELTKIQESLKDLFHTEIEEARRLLDETANQKAALELEAGRHLDTIEQLKKELAEKDEEIERLKKLIEELETKLANALGDIKEAKADNKRLQKENDDLRKQLADEQNNRLNFFIFIFIFFYLFTFFALHFHLDVHVNTVYTPLFNVHLTAFSITISLPRC